MPVLTVNTNVSKDKITSNLHAELAEFIAIMMNKPLGSVVVHLATDQSISFGSTTEPCAYGTMMAVGKLGVEENIKYTGELMRFFETKFGIPPSRFYLSFVDLKPSDVGYNGSTFHALTLDKIPFLQPKFK